MEFTMDIHEKAVLILEKTQDGNALASAHLHLLERAINGELGTKDQGAFDALYYQVRYDSYDAAKYYLFGIEHLTRDSQGYVYWRGKHVEHYSHSDMDAMKEEAQGLASRCLQLESKGFPVNSRTAINRLYDDVPAGTPWLEALCQYYCLFEGEGRLVSIFYYLGRKGVVVLERDASGELKQIPMDEAYHAFHFVQDQGLKAVPAYQNNYPLVLSFLDRCGLSPQDIHQAIA